VYANPVRESYPLLPISRDHSHSTLTGMNGLWTDDVENTSDTKRYKAVGKFE
jgi:hypothetical protein